MTLLCPEAWHAAGKLTVTPTRRGEGTGHRAPRSTHRYTIVPSAPWPRTSLGQNEIFPTITMLVSSSGTKCKKGGIVFNKQNLNTPRLEWLLAS